MISDIYIYISIHNNMFFGGDPFGHGGGGGRSHRTSRGGGGAAADTTKLYDTLGVSDNVRCWFICCILQHSHL